MNSFKLLVVFVLLLLGSFAQRFQRHSNGIKNGNGNTKMDDLDALSSDGENAVQNGDDVKFVGNVKEGIELELENKELAFKFCSDGCMDKVVIACYNSTNPNRLVRGDCGPGQCEFQAGVSVKDEEPFLWFKDKFFGKIDSDKCETAIMKYPKATPNGFQAFASCEPLKHDGNVVKLYVKHVEPGCPFYVENAKKWTPPLPTTISQNSSGTTVPNQRTSKSSEANTALWIGIGVGIFILLIVISGFGYCCYQTQIQKKPLFGKPKNVQQKVFLPEASKKANVVKEKAEDEKEVVAKLQPSKESTKEETTVTKEKQPKPSKELTQENATKEDAAPAKKVSAESTLQDLTNEASVVQKCVVQQQKQHHNGNPPRVFVPKTVIYPETKSVNAPKSGSLKTGKKDSLSGRHELGMEGLVESGPEQVKRRDTNVGLLNKETKEKLEKFYPRGPVRRRSNARTFDPVRAFDCREIEILCCARISIMFKTIEMLIDDAIKALNERGVTFDEKSNIIEMSPKAEKYLRSKSTPEYVKSFAFGNVFRDIIDAQTRFHERFSIPFLFSIVLQRRYTATNRRKAFTWIRRELIIIEKEFTAEERSELPYPICAIEAACKMDANGFKSVALLDSFSGDDDDDETQHSTRASEKPREN